MKYLKLTTLLLFLLCFHLPLRAQNRTVQLIWNLPQQPAGVVVTEIDVFSSSTSGGPYTKIGAVAPTATLYTVTNVAPGTYFYVVASLSTGGTQSINSNEATAIVSAQGGGCLASAAAWSNSAFAAQSAKFIADMDVSVSQSPADIVVGLSPAAAMQYSDLSAIVRFNDQGFVDAFNGTTGAYAAAVSIPFTAGTYHIRLVVDPVAKTYDVYVTPPLLPTQQVTSSYGFRNQASMFANLGTFSATGTANICNFALSAASQPPPVAITIVPTSASLNTSTTQQFTATVANTTNTAVVWSAVKGTVSATGLYTAPSAAGSDSVMATSGADPSKAATTLITITAPVQIPPAITTTSLSAGTVGVAYSAALTCTPSCTWSATNLPAGLAISGQSITGIPTTAGTPNVVLTATLNGASSSKTLPLQIVASPAGPVVGLTCQRKAQFSICTIGLAREAVLTMSLNGAVTTWQTFTGTAVPNQVTIQWQNSLLKASGQNVFSIQVQNATGAQVSAQANF